MIMNDFKKYLLDSAGMRVFIYMFSLLVCLVIGAAITYWLAEGDNILWLKVGQGVSSALLFIVPPLVLYAFTRNQPLREIGFKHPNSYGMLLIGTVLVFVTLPLTNLLTSWNESMKLPEALAQLEAWMEQMEKTAGDFTERMLQVDTFGGLLGNLLVIALIPAVGEELTFRGLLQQSLVRRCKNPHVGIILSAAVFAFIHFQFYGFLPRLFLGILLGYLFHYSGSLWTSILMHFINNGSAVVVAYLDHKGITQMDWEHFGETDHVWILIASALLTVGLIFLSYKTSNKHGRQQSESPYRIE